MTLPTVSITRKARSPIRLSRLPSRRSTLLRKVHRARRTTIKRGWVEVMINRRELNLSDPDSEAMKTKAVNTRVELCQMLAEGLAKSRRALVCPENSPVRDDRKCARRSPATPRSHVHRETSSFLRQNYTADDVPPVFRYI